MTAANKEIVNAFEKLGLTPEQIAEEYQFELAAVKSILFSCSKVFRNESTDNEKLEFTDEEYQSCKDVIMQYARYGEENPHLQVKCAMFVVQDKKGYLDPRKALPQFNFNVLSINERMKQVADAERRTLERKQQQIQDAEIVTMAK